jgi:hypothetical protein
LNYDANTKRGFYGARIKADAEYVYFKKKKKKVLLSAFFGITEEINPISIFSDYQRYRMPLGIGGTNGNNDFAFTSLFLARYNQEGGILSNQIRSDQGGVLLPSGVYVQSNLSNFVSLKGEVELPIGLPLSKKMLFTQRVWEFLSYVITSRFTYLCSTQNLILALTTVESNLRIPLCLS